MHIRFGPGATRKRTCHNGHLASGLPVLRYAGEPASPISLSLRNYPKVLLIEVYDTDSNPPVLSSADSGAESGRGLMLVNALSKEWWYSFPPGGGKVVYCFLEKALPLSLRQVARHEYLAYSGWRIGGRLPPNGSQLNGTQLCGHSGGVCGQSGGTSAGKQLCGHSAGVGSP